MDEQKKSAPKPIRDGKGGEIFGAKMKQLKNKTQIL